MTLKTTTELQNALAAWVNLVLPGGRVFQAKQNAPRPQMPYVTLRISDIDPIGHDDRGKVDLVTGLQTIYGDRLLSVSVNAYGSGAMDMVRKLHNSIWKRSISAALLASGLAPQLPGPINDLGSMLETKYEERFHCDIKFGLKDIDTDFIGVIEHVAGTGTVLRDGSQDAGVLGDAPIGSGAFGGEPLLTITFAGDLG